MPGRGLRRRRQREGSPGREGADGGEARGGGGRAGGRGRRPRRPLGREKESSLAATGPSRGGSARPRRSRRSYTSGSRPARARPQLPLPFPLGGTRGCGPRLCHPRREASVRRRSGQAGRSWEGGCPGAAEWAGPGGGGARRAWRAFCTAGTGKVRTKSVGRPLVHLKISRGVSFPLLRPFFLPSYLLPSPPAPFSSFLPFLSLKTLEKLHTQKLYKCKLYQIGLLCLMASN